MSTTPGCSRCPAGAPVTGDMAPEGWWRCREHGEVAAVWRPEEAGYASFVEQLALSGEHPTYLPWPLDPVWTVSDHGRVGLEQGSTVATVTCCSGTSPLDGPVDLLVVSEEPGVGLGARCAGLSEHAPGAELRDGRPAVRVRLDHQPVALWSLSTAAFADLDRSVLVGEAGGRWLWLVLRPASAILMLGEDWALRAAAGLGPFLVEATFGGPRPPW